MNRKIATLIAITLLVTGASTRLAAADAAIDAATQKRIDQKVTGLINAAKITDADKVAKVKAIGADWFATLFAWHKENDPKLGTLWADWNKARAVVPKDEFPGELVAVKIEEAYSSLKPAYNDYIKRLS